MFILNDKLSNNIVKIPVQLDTSLFCSLSINDIKEEKLILYPNPSSDKINLPSQFINSDYEIYSINGQVLLKGNIKENSLNISVLKEGTYMMKIIKVN